MRQGPTLLVADPRPCELYVASDVSAAERLWYGSNRERTPPAGEQASAASLRRSGLSRLIEPQAVFIFMLAAHACLDPQALPCLLHRAALDGPCRDFARFAH